MTPVPNAVITSTELIDVYSYTGVPAYLDAGLSRHARRYHLGRALHGQDLSTCDRTMVDYSERWGASEARAALEQLDRQGIDLPSPVTRLVRKLRWGH